MIDLKEILYIFLQWTAFLGEAEQEPIGVLVVTSGFMVWLSVMKTMDDGKNTKQVY